MSSRLQGGDARARDSPRFHSSRRPRLLWRLRVLESGVKVATREKALLDMLYLSATRNRLFARLPALELPRDFDRRRAQDWISRITSPQLARTVQRRYAALVKKRR